MTHARILDAAARLANEYLSGLPARQVGSRADTARLKEALGGPLPGAPSDGVHVIEHLARVADAGLVASAGPRYFGFVTGGAVPAAVAADWLTSAWDQNGALMAMSPTVAVLEDIVAGWLLELLDLPRGASVGFVTGAHMANFTCLAAARHEVLRRVNWNVEEQGLQQAPRLTVLAGDDAHVSVSGALRMLGVGAREVQRIPADDQGRMRPDAMAAALAASDGPTIVCAQAGNVSTGASDPFAAIVEAAHAKGAWVHVDGAFGLWAAAVPGLRAQVSGVALADSWATDAHKWLNVPYDSGLAIVAHPAAHRAAMSMDASYLVRGAGHDRAGMDWVPDSSRRARVIPLYALIRSLGRQGIQAIIARNCALARRIAARLSRPPQIAILNDVVLNQVLVRFDDDDDRTREVIACVQGDGTCWAGGAAWQGRQVMRISISNWSTTEEDVDRAADAIARCARALRG